MKRLLVITAAVLLVLVGIGGWFFLAPMPDASTTVADSRSVRVGGRERSYLVVAPASIPAGAPVLVVLHGSLMDGVKMRRMLGPRFERLASRHGAVVVYPSGVEGHFNDGRRVASYSARMLDIDDVGFMRAIVDDLAAQRRIDRRRVHVFGYSNGGAMAMRLAAEAPDLVAGVIVANANVPAPDNMGWTLAATPARTRVVLLEGSRDPINPYEGGRVTIFGFGDRGDALSASDSARWFAGRAGLAPEPVADSSRRIDGLEVRTQDWGSPTRLRLVSMLGAGHTVPQPDYRFPRFLGATVRSDVLLDEAWALVDGP